MVARVCPSTTGSRLLQLLQLSRVVARVAHYSLLTAAQQAEAAQSEVVRNLCKGDDIIWHLFFIL
jgi:hypothetical protein